MFSQLYGQTECYPVSVLRKSDHDPRTPELFLSCGFPIAACEVKILDDNDQEVKTGEAGEYVGRSRKEIADGSGVDEKQVYLSLYRLSRDGKIFRGEGHKWVVKVDAPVA